MFHYIYLMCHLSKTTLQNYQWNLIQLACERYLTAQRTCMFEVSKIIRSLVFVTGEVGPGFGEERWLRHKFI